MDDLKSNAFIPLLDCLLRFWLICFWQVSDEGDVLYVFPKDYRSNLTAKSFRMKVEPFLEKAKVLVLFYCWFQCVLFWIGLPIIVLFWVSLDTLQLAGEYLVRVSFGTALIASIVIVYTTIIAILSSRRYPETYQTSWNHFLPTFAWNTYFSKIIVFSFLMGYLSLTFAFFTVKKTIGEDEADLMTVVSHFT